MSAPITWRNIEAPDFRGATAGIATVSNSLDAARKLFTQSIADAERIDAENWDNTKTNNTNAVLNRLLSFGDLESFEKAMASGELQNLLSQYGAQIDANRVREVMDSRGDLLRRRAIEALDYQTRLRKEEEDRITREQKPILDRLQGLVEQGELQSARDAARIYAESGMLQEDALRQVLQAARTRQESIEDRELHKRKVEATIKAQEDQAAAARDQARAIKQAYEMLGRHHALTNAADSGNEETVKKWMGQTIIGQGTLENGEGRAALETIISKYKLTPNAAQDLRQNLEEYFPRGYYTRTINGKKERIPIPVALVDLALAATDEIGDGALWSRRGDKARKYIQRALEDPNILNAIKEAVTVRDGRIAVRAQSALDPQALDVGATINTDTLLQLGKWMAPPGNQR